jgi:nucleoside-diphosphate-sugar epimerase
VGVKNPIVRDRAGRSTGRILITGASGFIGRAVVAAFAEHGLAVRAAVRQPPHPPFNPGVEVVQHPDLARPFDWRPLLDGIVDVIHLAGISQSSRHIDAKLYDRVNKAATARLANAAAACGIRRFVFVSSIQAQSGGAADHALTENDTPAPTGAYGRSKLAAEKAVRAAGVPFTIMRPVVLYGPGAAGSIASLARAAASPWPLPLKDFSNRRSFLGIDNFISALAFVLSSPVTVGETYVVADPGIPPPLCGVIAMLREAMDRRPLLFAVPRRYVEIPLRLIGRSDAWNRFGGNLRVDAAKLIAAGWQPLHDTRAGLAAMVKQPAAVPAPDRLPK